MDESRNGVDNQVRLHVDSGYRVFAYKLVKGTKRNLTDIAITVLSLFPRALDKIQSTKKPFVYSIRHKANRLTYLSLKPIREVEPLPELFTKRPTKKTKKRKQTIKIDNSPTLFP
jgi:hypothetical protein